MSQKSGFPQRIFNSEFCLTSLLHVLWGNYMYWSRSTQLLYILSCQILSGFQIVSIYFFCTLWRLWPSTGFLQRPRYLMPLLSSLQQILRLNKLWILRRFVENNSIGRNMFLTRKPGFQKRMFMLHISSRFHWKYLLKDTVTGINTTQNTNQQT